MISNAFLREFDWQRRRFVGYLQIECHTGWWDALGAVRGMQRAKLIERAGEGLRVRFFGLAWG